MTLRENKTIEITINLKKITRKASWRYKASSCIKAIRKLVNKMFHTKAEVLIAPDVNKRVFKNGMHNIPTKMRVRVERVASPKLADENAFKISLVNVSTFRGLNAQSIAE